MISFKVNNRFSGEVQFTAEIDCPKNAATGIKLGLAVKWAHETRANLARANLARANLDGANLDGAYLARAYLDGANLDGAYLARAYLDRAYLDGKEIRALCGRVTRNDGYEFMLWLFKDGAHVIRAGCRTFTADEYRAHVAAKYPDTDKARETLAIIAFLEARLEAVAAVLPKPELAA